MTEYKYINLNFRKDAFSVHMPEARKITETEEGSADRGGVKGEGGGQWRVDQLGFDKNLTLIFMFA